MANLEDLEKMITDEEGKIENSYTEIGKVYFELHADSCEPAFAALVSNIKDSLSKIEDCKNDIRKLKGLMLCPGCGLEIPEDTYTCSECGFKIKEEPLEEGMIRCNACGNAIREEVAFCYFCGTKVEKEVVETEVAVEETVVQEVVEETPVIEEPIVETVQEPEVVEAPAPAVQNNVPICANCKNPLKPGVAFCTTCGTKVEAAPEVNATPVVEGFMAQSVEVAPAAPVVEKPALAENANLCPMCKQPLAPGATFCTYCGAKVEVSANAPVEATAQKFCTKCGKPVAANTKFCTGCGSMIG